MKFDQLFCTIFIVLLILFSCTHDQIWQDNPRTILSNSEVNSEISIKLNRVYQFLDENNLDGIFLTQVRNFYWITAGLGNNQIVRNNEIGAASVLILRNGKKYLICKGSEADRLMDDSMAALGYELVRYDWYKSNPKYDIREKILDRLSDDGTIGSDVKYPGTILVSGKFAKLRYKLTDTEIKKYRWLGKECTEAVEHVCRSIIPGMDEYEIEYITANALLSRGITPTVLLIAADERIYKYRHALAGGKKLERYAMINVVGEKWGMSIAVTRFVHFGTLPNDLRLKLKAVAKLNTLFEISTVPGKPLNKIFEECKEWYADVGWEGEWKLHHQGGATGYMSRELAIYPGVDGVVLENQAYAWNPTITGAKIEDTIIIHADSFEVVTRSENWPLIPVTLNERTYWQPDILIRKN